jgi:Fur family transcriptional regulator, ferric uptake regulator
MDTVDFKEFLNEKNFCFTAQRLAVLNVVAKEENKHLSATEIYEALQEEHQGIGIATVYKTLRMLEQEGLLSKIELLDKTAHYEINDGAIHGHLICSKCGKIIEIRGSRARRSLELLQGDSNFAIQQGSVNLYGICEDCLRLQAYPV